MKTYGYDEHSNTFVFDGQSFTFTPEDMVAMKVVKEKGVDIWLIKTLGYEQANVYNNLVGHQDRQLTQEQFKVVKDWTKK